MGWSAEDLIWVGLTFFLIVLPLFYLGNILSKGLQAADERAAERNQQRLIGEMQRTDEKRERSFLKPCTNCQAFAITLPHRDRLGRTYCSPECAEWLDEGPRDFCGPCRQETTEVEAGDLNRINGIGLAFVGSSERCDTCRSEIRRVWFTLLFLPVIPLARYRVILASRHHFLSRRLL